MPAKPTLFMKAVLQAVLLLIAGAANAAAQRPASDANQMGPLRFFVGSWRGVQSGQPGDGASERTYEFVLNNRFLQGRNVSTYPPQAKNPKGEVHHDLGMIGYDAARKRFVFRQFHQEGFVNTYVQQDNSDAKKLVFNSEAIENVAAGWRARETYWVLNQNEFIERFELAPPGKDFELYTEAHLKRILPK